MTHSPASMPGVPERGRYSPNQGASSTRGNAIAEHMELPDLPQRAFRARWPGRLLRDPGAVVGLALIVALVGMALLAPWLAPHDPKFLFDDGTSDSGAPLGHSAKFLLGTDP